MHASDLIRPGLHGIPVSDWSFKSVNLHSGGRPKKSTAKRLARGQTWILCYWSVFSPSSQGLSRLTFPEM